MSFINFLLGNIIKGLCLRSIVRYKTWMPVPSITLLEMFPTSDILLPTFYSFSFIARCVLPLGSMIQVMWKSPFTDVTFQEDRMLQMAQAK